ncbi:MAG: two-component sensor histidine kinase [Burkholderiales bacterium]|nr:MAG: two-component sensor histidine kinase [Burkholderiales bacterium]
MNVSSLSTLNGEPFPGTQEEADALHLLYYSRITCWVAMLLVASGVLLDLAFYPEHGLEFGLVRVLVVLGIGLALWSHSTTWGRAHMRQTTRIWTALPQIMIAWMIFRTDGEASIYFVGLTFALAGIVIFLPLSVMEALGFSALTLAAYVLACVLRQEGVQDWPQLLGQMVFLLFYGVIAVTVSVFSGRWRRHAHRLQAEILRQRDQLLEVNHSLAEVKGQLVQREKMAALGTLSAGLLHELNNPVNYSLMAINMGLSTPAAGKDELLRESLNDAREGMERVQNIVSDLKTFAYQKPGADVLRPFLLEKAVQSARRLAGFELKGIEVRIDMPQDSHVVGEEPAIIGVMINLLSNAAHALAKAARDKPEIRVSATIEGERMRVRVRDNGQGIAAEHIDRVFEPFFTTRDVGAGLGLGLSVSYGIIQRHGGILSVASEPGVWTEFSFDLGRPQP